MASALRKNDDLVMRLATLSPEPDELSLGGDDWKCVECGDDFHVVSYHPRARPDDDEEGFILQLPYCQGKDYGEFVAACYRGVPAALGMINELVQVIRDAARKMDQFDLAGAAYLLRSTVRELDRPNGPTRP